MQAASIRQSVVLGVSDGKRPHVIRRFVLECGKVGTDWKGQYRTDWYRQGRTDTGKDIPVHITGIYVTYLHSPRSGGLHIAYVYVTYVTDT